MTLPKDLEPDRVYPIPVGKLMPDPDQPRKVTPSKQSLDSLAESIKALGVRQPITVRQAGRKLMIVTGERRWRAAQIAGLKEVPCILAGDDEAIARAAAQLAENLEREGLSPMQTAQFLVGLREREKKSTNELVAELGKLGIKNISRARVDKLLEFVNLPAWAQKLLEAGQLAETHATHIVTVARFPAVLEDLQGSIEDRLDWSGEVTAEEIRHDVAASCERVGRLLHAPGRATDLADPHARRFDLQLCKGCEARVKIGKVEYCVDPAAFDLKNADAKAAAQQLEQETGTKAGKKAGKPVEDRSNPDPAAVTPRKVPLTADGVVKVGTGWDEQRAGEHERISDGGFDPATCEGCPHKHPASTTGTAEFAEDYCFHLPCYAVKHRQAQRASKHDEKLEVYLDDWLRGRVIEQLPQKLKPLQAQGLMFWLATGAVNRGGQWHPGQAHHLAARETQGLLKDYALWDTPRVYAFGMDPDHKRDRELAIAVAAVRAMTAEQVRWFARELGLKLDGLGYVIDSGYMQLQRKAAVLALAKRGELENAKGGVGELKARILADDTAVQKIGVPDDLRAIYAAPFKPAEDDQDDEDLERYDDDGEEE